VTATHAVASYPAPSFTHVRRLTDAGGMYEHALGTVPRREHGYCVDDVARGLVVLSREDEPDLAVLRAELLAFVLAAQSDDGRFRNRRDAELRWTDEPSVEDCWGRALWGLGAVCSDPGALAAFTRGAAWRSPWSRATAFAGLGAAAVLALHPDHEPARDLLADAARTVRDAGADTGWPWPEPRLTYANAAVPEVLIAAGHLLEDPALLTEGLSLLAWLVDVQLRDGLLSVVPVGGRGPGDPDVAAFDQQPIEVAALADACALAHDLTGAQRWADGVAVCAAWFLGDNDSRTPLLDPESGGGCDGLERHGRNDNQGAESTLAAVSTLQQARALLP
jgi:hypothetical protein